MIHCFARVPWTRLTPEFSPEEEVGEDKGEEKKRGESFRGVYNSDLGAACSLPWRNLQPCYDNDTRPGQNGLEDLFDNLRYEISGNCHKSL